MINQQLKLLIEYRLSESEETLREAKILLNQSAFVVPSIALIMQCFMRHWVF